MTKPTSYRLPDPTKAQIEELAKRLDTNETTVVTMAIRDMYYKEIRTMTTYINIDLETDESLTNDWSGIDEQDSVAKFDELLYAKLHDRYPQAEINIQTYALRTHVDTDGPQDVEATVRHYINDIHNSGDWVVAE